jgi:mono/diheme cytochrome c family protein
MKSFRVNNQLIETRLFMRHPDGDWAGYTYEWNDAQTAATRVVSGKTRMFGSQTWVYPSEVQCLQCHTTASGRSLGLETAQLNGNFDYPQTGRIANQVATLNSIGVLSPPVTGTLPALHDPYGTAGTVVERARAYLHTNCSNCHRPNGGTPSTLDLRWQRSLAQTNACDVAPSGTTLGIANARLIAPGEPDRSVLPERVNRRDQHAMPPIGSTVIDAQGVALLRQWIQGLSSCQ